MLAIPKKNSNLGVLISRRVSYVIVSYWMNCECDVGKQTYIVLLIIAVPRIPLTGQLLHYRPSSGLVDHKK